MKEGGRKGGREGGSKQASKQSGVMLDIMRPLSRQRMCALSRVKKICSVIFSYVLMLLGTGGCYPNVPPSPPFGGHADGSEQTSCGHSK